MYNSLADANEFCMRMPRCVTLLFFFLLSPLVAQVAVFWQSGLPTVASQPIDREILSPALHPNFRSLNALTAPGA